MIIVKCDYCNKEQPTKTVPSNKLSYTTTVILSGKSAELSIEVTAPENEHICKKCAKAVAKLVK